MATAPTSAGVSQVAEHNNQNYTTPLVIITLLFFMWGLLTAMNDVLIPHLKNVYTLSYTQAMMVQFCFFFAYAVVSLPAGMLIRKIGYQNGAVTGLVIAGFGCFLFYPASMSTYSVFLLAFFILAAGITVLQVAANPYVTVLGPARTASSRLNLTQAFNSLGTTIAPTLGGLLILAAAGEAIDSAALSELDAAAAKAKEAAAVQMPYLVLAGSLIALAIFFKLAKLPKITHDSDPVEATSSEQTKVSIFAKPHLLLGALGIFMYVGGEVAIGSFLVNFFGEDNIAGLKEHQAAAYVSFYWGGAMIGRFIGFVVMRHVQPGKVLAVNCLAAIALVLSAVFFEGKIAMWSIIAVGLCNSIMFPTIFSMALHKLGGLTSQGSGLLCVAIVGGAFIPLLQGVLADSIGIQMSFLLPAACYGYILFYGVKYANLFNNED
ncbi:L-fucose:H+ symporter permease [Gilvimarinus agarilyticus]|uniref:L-fucose:H+ symporter permease n=1 Tax=unclassified Gilvimarinus TaxID=2642066 RepID=UPI001C0819F1|nr:MULTISPECIES: L-fucose:H+ symporter permease [unclassified Gilvimarinus]MBU2886015.1 L-fucose:H+ symporter permease [Gilvimarinus agarilyticus]MDO6570761.1 L-fucose:H+ symporter permease [Gilvimarinus sp. 2_MG-2023]MDO6747646.1 L-fucose:H+ symporter permease [Gilvimarinus sp. 1_MG-2023]